MKNKLNKIFLALWIIAIIYLLTTLILQVWGLVDYCYTMTGIPIMVLTIIGYWLTI